MTEISKSKKVFIGVGAGTVALVIALVAISLNAKSNDENLKAEATTTAVCETTPVTYIVPSIGTNPPDGGEETADENAITSSVFTLADGTTVYVMPNVQEPKRNTTPPATMPSFTTQTYLEIPATNPPNITLKPAETAKPKQNKSRAGYPQNPKDGDTFVRDDGGISEYSEDLQAWGSAKGQGTPPGITLSPEFEQSLNEKYGDGMGETIGF